MAQSVIYYFSATGNSLAAARRIAQAIEPCALVPMAAALKDGRLLDCRSKRVGLVFPLYYAGLPNIVAAFLQKARFPAGTYLFAAVTAGHNFGRAIAEADDILKPQGQKIAYGRYLVMPDNYLPVFNLPRVKATHILAKGDRRLAETAGDVAACRTGIRENRLGLGALMRFWHRRSMRAVPEKDRQFTVDEACTSCGLCARVCPTDNLIMKDRRPEWRHQCEHCLACIQFCPARAIQFGISTRKRPRYHHPDVTAADIAQQKETGR